jgi:hypothetical protein
VKTGAGIEFPASGNFLGSRFCLKVPAHYAGADGSLVPRMRPARGTHPCLPVVTKPVPARMRVRRPAKPRDGTRFHFSTFMFRCDGQVMVVSGNDECQNALETQDAS